MPGPRIEPADLDDPALQRLLASHLDQARAATAEGSAHALDLAALRVAEISVWVVRDGDVLLGVGALRRLGADHGDLKSMYVARAARRRGVGTLMLRHLIALARAQGLSRLSLETGSWPYFAPAHALYRRHGFVECAPFGDYAPDPNSLFMTLDLGRA